MSLFTEALVWGLENIPPNSLTPAEQMERREILGSQLMQSHEISTKQETCTTREYSDKPFNHYGDANHLPGWVRNADDTASNKRTSSLVAEFDKYGVHEDSQCTIH